MHIGAWRQKNQLSPGAGVFWCYSRKPFLNGNKRSHSAAVTTVKILYTCVCAKFRAGSVWVEKFRLISKPTTYKWKLVHVIVILSIFYPQTSLFSFDRWEIWNRQAEICPNSQRDTLSEPGLEFRKFWLLVLSWGHTYFSDLPNPDMSIPYIWGCVWAVS